MTQNLFNKFMFFFNTYVFAINILTDSVIDFLLPHIDKLTASITAIIYLDFSWC